MAIKRHSVKHTTGFARLYCFYWRASEASEASETLSGVYKFELIWYVYIYIYGGTCAIIVTHATYT